MKNVNKENKFYDIWILLVAFLILPVLTAGVWCFTSGKPESLTGRKLTEWEQQDIIKRNSPLTDYVYLTANASFPREEKIAKITIHHMAADLSIEEVGNLFADSGREASANYGIDSEGRIGLYVEEQNRAWTSSNSDNDARAVTIEVADEKIGENWHVSDQAYAALIELCTDICMRNGIGQLVFTGDAEGNLTMHKMFDSETECPGSYLESRMPEIAEMVNQRLSEK